jgi:ABC-2 type transport system ATP-binding protein
MGLYDLKGVSKRFGKTFVLDRVTLSIEEGELLGVVGMNGSGKTTLLKVLIGYYRPDQGTILYRGVPVHKVKEQLRKDVGFTAQENSFYPSLTVEENLAYYGSLYGLPERSMKEHLERALVFLDLQGYRHRLAQELSGGMQRRLEIACSLIHDPKILILDEPTEDLDPVLRRDILHLIKRINDLGTTVIFTSHLLSDVEALCDRIAILHHGSLMKIGKVDELRRATQMREEVHLQTASGNYDTLIRDLHLKEFYTEGARLVIYTTEADKLVHALLHVLENEHDRLVYLDIKKPSLQEVFEQITESRL